MYKSFILIILLLFTFFKISLAQNLTLFPSENSAHLHCPQDQVVWLNLPTGIWHYKGQRWYGRTKQGAYVCVTDAAASGNRATLNRQ